MTSRYVSKSIVHFFILNFAMSDTHIYTVPSAKQIPNNLLISSTEEQAKFYNGYDDRHFESSVNQKASTDVNQRSFRALVIFNKLYFVSNIDSLKYLCFEWYSNYL